MTDQACSRCAALEAENAALRARIVQLERIIEQLRRRLETIRRYASDVLDRTRPILGRRSGVPRGKWSYARGADLVADTVHKLTGTDR